VWRVLTVVERMGASLAEASFYLTAALKAIDEEITNLQRILEADAIELHRVIDEIGLTEADREKILAVGVRIEETALRVTRFVHPMLVDAPDDEPGSDSPGALPPS
jgi:hypothetical protein